MHRLWEYLEARMPEKGSRTKTVNCKFAVGAARMLIEEEKSIEERLKAKLWSEPLLGKIRTAWCHYNELASELEYSLSEGGDTDVTRDQVEHAWEDLNSLIMPNADLTGKQKPENGGVKCLKT